MKKIPVCTAILLVLLAVPQAAAAKYDTLVPVGQVVGLELQEDRVTVAAFDDALGADTKKAGLRVGDEIESIDGQEIHSARDVRHALTCSGGSITMEVLRGGKTHQLRLTPQITSDGPRLGVYLREGITGIGTVTWFDPDSGAFGTLGHGVSDGNGSLLCLTGGRACSATVASIKRGKSGDPGQLRGSFQPEQVLGTLTGNTEQGVFGSAVRSWEGAAIPVAEGSQVHTGSAVIRSDAAGDGVREYSVEILKIYPKTADSSRNLLIHVTDPALLELTGGIVQGMSGSPLIQDGKLIGAVTHVLVNDPTTGYGILIENMLDAAA